jgi:hypothetical protein
MPAEMPAAGVPWDAALVKGRRMATMNVLQRLRKRKTAVARMVLPLLATVWFSTSASLCFGMAADSEDVRVDPASAGHDHYSQTDDQHNQDAHSHGACPHCPPGGSHDEPTVSHILCSVLDDVSDARSQPSALKKFELEHLLPVAHAVPSSTLVALPVVRGISHSLSPPHPSVSLSIRHCVFLI